MRLTVLTAVTAVVVIIVPILELLRRRQLRTGSASVGDR